MHLKWIKQCSNLVLYKVQNGNWSTNIYVMKVKSLGFSVKDNLFGIILFSLILLKKNKMLSEFMNAVHCIQICQAMVIYLYMYKNILDPEL